MATWFESLPSAISIINSANGRFEEKIENTCIRACLIQGRFQAFYIT